MSDGWLSHLNPPDTRRRRKAPVRRGYRAGVECIALNDEPCEMDPAEMTGFASVMVVAMLFGKDQRTVAEDVVRLRRRLQEQGAA